VQASLITDHPMILAGLTVGSSGFFPAEVSHAVTTVISMISPITTDTPISDAHILFKQALEEAHLLVAIFMGTATGAGAIWGARTNSKRLKFEQKKWDGQKRRKGDE